MYTDQLGLQIAGKQRCWRRLRRLPFHQRVKIKKSNSVIGCHICLPWASCSSRFANASDVNSVYLPTFLKVSPVSQTMQQLPPQDVCILRILTHANAVLDFRAPSSPPPFPSSRHSHINCQADQVQGRNFNESTIK